ncbi:unnamed protein product [Paramecium octaurelia]|uniref:Uncharacterized protein n=1 Tax=Paramecium octaurelia TaxID=43137 RepID=A0A8S1Y0M0_PAROT|nr:unnamed protein product [Paramecium octaurelia]
MNKSKPMVRNIKSQNRGNQLQQLSNKKEFDYQIRKRSKTQQGFFQEVNSFLRLGGKYSLRSGNLQLMIKKLNLQIRQRIDKKKILQNKIEIIKEENFEDTAINQQILKQHQAQLRAKEQIDKVMKQCQKIKLN